MCSRQVDCSTGVLARCKPPFPLLQPVIHRVPDHMRQGIGQALNHGFVDFTALALGDQTRHFAGAVRRFAHDARHPLEQGLHWLRADRHNRLLNVAGQQAVILDMGDDIGIGCQAQFLHPLRNHRLVDDQFANRVDQPVHPVQINPQRGFRSTVFLRRSGINRLVFRNTQSGSCDINPLFR